MFAFFYLDELIEDIANRTPDHPLVAVFRPVLTKNRGELEKEASKYYNQIAESDLPADVRSKLTDVFVNWIEQRFSEKGKKEIEEMLIGALPALRDTQSGKDLIQIGRVEAKIEDLLMLLESRFGSLEPTLRERLTKLSSTDQVNKLLLQVITIKSPSDLVF